MSKPERTEGTPSTPERLTEEQYTQLRPLLQLADLGNKNPLTERMKPGQLKRAELKRRSIEALREHGTITHAAAAAGVGVTTIYRWRSEDPEYAAAVLEFMHVDQVDTLHESLYKIATTPTDKTANAAVQAGKFLLQSLDRKTYGDHQTIESTQTTTHQVQVIHEVRHALTTQQQTRLQALRGTIDAPSTDDETPALPTSEGETP